MPLPRRLAPCFVESCDYVGPLKREMCPKHYQQWRAQYGDELPPKPSYGKIGECSAKDCDYLGSLKRGMCGKHYQRWWKHHKYAPKHTAIGKVCTECGVDKPLTEFGKDVRSYDGHRAWCLECTNRYNREWRANNSEKAAEYGKNWRTRKATENNQQASLEEPFSACTDDDSEDEKPIFLSRTPEYQQQYYLSQRYKWHLFTKYRITPEDFDSLLISQGGGCAICGRAVSGDSDGRKLSVDHCHTTGLVRGILCGQCNRGIGALGDDPNRLLAAAAYLISFRDSQISSSDPRENGNTENKKSL